MADELREDLRGEVRTARENRTESKKSYAAPQLTEFGRIEEIAATTTGGGKDNFGTTT